MIRFDCDYLEGAHPKILKKIVDTNYEQTTGYGTDEYTKNTILKLKKVLKNDDVDIHFMTGGTQTNMTVIASILRPYQAVICANTGHINVHEAGAVEASGHKIITIDSEDGKLDKEKLEELIKKYNDEETPEHMVMPKLVFISLPTECGTNYTKTEVEEIYNVCKKNNMYLYIDGARLGYGLVAKDTDIKIEDMTKICDVFYIGGTKIGAMFGEAVVIVNDKLKPDFRFYIKQVGGLLAKGRMLSIQFDCLFEKELYFTIAKVAVDHAIRIKEALISKGYTLKYNSFTNQQFVVMDNAKLEDLRKDFGLYKWEEIDDNTSIVRICTSWATTKEQVDKLIEKL